jgi:hypothetical protein
MKISVNNIDSLLRVELSKIASIVDIDDASNGLFLIWTNADEKEMFDRQTHLITTAINKKMPIIIFDKYQTMDPDEISFMMKSGVFLWEPAVADRMFFSFQPVWGRLRLTPQDIPWDFDSEKRPIDLAYMSSMIQKMPTFKKYFAPIAEIGEFRVYYFDKIGSENINRKIEEIGVTVGPQTNINKTKMTLLLGTDQDYRVGRLDPKLFEYLEAGIVPMLPVEHRWYHSVFRDLTVDGEDQIEYFLRTVDRIGFGSVYEIYQNINDNLPEADVINVAKRIKTFFE